MQTNGLGVAMNPFLGWPLQKTYQVFRQLREPNGEATTKALRTGLTAYLAIVPVGMAVSWLRNKFDEEVLGRKQNVSDLGTIHDMPSALLTALDNASRVGTFGFIGEGANYFLNDDNSRPVTLDNRIFFVNTIENTFNAARALYHQTLPELASGNLESAAATATDYQTVVRPLFQTLGGNGLLQNLGAINHMLSLDDSEARVSNRISVNNYLRVTGRELGMDVRTFGGMLQNSSTPSPIQKNPQWVAIEDNTAGYDVLSYDPGIVQPLNRLIEVKSTIASPLRFQLTRHEWEHACKFGPSYHFHIWDLQAPPYRLYERSAAEIAPHIPKDNEKGRWKLAEIPVV